MDFGEHLLEARRSFRLQRQFDPAVPRVAGEPVLGSLRAFRNDAFGVLKHADVLGDVARVDLAYRAVWFVKHPDAVAELLETQENWERSPGLAPLLGRNPLTTNGEEWVKHRQFAQPSFHPRMTDRATSAFAQDAAPLVADWERFAREGAEVDLAREIVRVFARCAGRAFGLELTPEEADAFPSAALRLQRWAFGVVAGGARRTAQVDADMAMLEGVVRRAIDAPPAPDRPPSYVERLRQDLDMPREALRDHLMLLLLAPADNPPNAAAFVLWTLARHPAWEERVRAEVAEVLGGELPTPDALARMPVLERVVQETLRLYPPVWILARLARRDTHLHGHPVRQGAMAFSPPYFVHRHPSAWENPEVFDPDRFLPAAVERRHRYAYIPFGAGPRMCIGARIATLEVRAFVALFLQRLRVAWVEDSLPLEGLFALRSRTGIRARLATVA